MIFWTSFVSLSLNFIIQ